jgi:hypothetical protein
MKRIEKLQFIMDLNPNYTNKINEIIDTVNRLQEKMIEGCIKHRFGNDGICKKCGKYELEHNNL